MSKKKKAALYVDVDNIYIINKKINSKLLRRRIKVIEGLDVHVKYFGNSYTANILKRHNINIDMSVSDVAKNSADHSLLHAIYMSDYKKIYILSSDMTLVRLAYFMFPNKIVQQAQFENDGAVYLDTIDLNFNHKDLHKFIESLELYKSRYIPS